MNRAGQTEGHIKITMPDGEEVIWTSVETTALETYDGPYNITENGVLATSDKKLTANIVVDVPAPVPTLIEKNIAANGTYTAASDNADGYSEVNVNVPIPQPTLVTKSITANGTYNASGDNADGYSSVTVNVSDDDDPIKEALDAMIPNWTCAFGVYNNNYIYYSNIMANAKTIKASWVVRSNEVTIMNRMFSNDYRITSIPLFDTSNVVDMQFMFVGCYNLIDVPLFNTSNVTNMYDMFDRCLSLTSIPLFNTSNVTNMSYMFSECSSLTIVPALDMRNVTNMSYMFQKCSKLEEIHMYGMKVSFNIAASIKFTHEALVEILNNLATVNTTRTLTMGSTNLAKLTEEDKAIALNKGWTLA